jgi:hypothetical protein
VHPTQHGKGWTAGRNLRLSPTRGGALRPNDTAKPGKMKINDMSCIGSNVRKPSSHIPTRRTAFSSSPTALLFCCHSTAQNSLFVEAAESCAERERSICMGEKHTILSSFLAHLIYQIAKSPRSSLGLSILHVSGPWGRMTYLIFQRHVPVKLLDREPQNMLLVGEVSTRREVGTN